MKNLQLQRWTGILFIVGALLVNLPYTLLGINFEYPAILRQDTGQILSKFNQGGTGLIFEWLAFAWVGLPLLIAVVLLQKVFAPENPTVVKIATLFGVTALIVQVIGLLRWVFVVPILATRYTAPGASASSKEAVEVVFSAVHQFGGVLLGEHIGQLFTIIWMCLISLVMFKSAIFKPWLGVFGLIAAGVYLTAQTELFATVIPGFPVIPATGLIGSLLWLGWLVVMGIFLVRSKYTETQSYAAKNFSEFTA